MYDLSECSDRTPNYVVDRFNVDYWRAISYGLGRASYTTDTEIQPVFGHDDRTYYTGTVHYHALTNTDYFGLRWSSADDISHRALKYETVYQYGGELLAMGFEFIGSTVDIASRNSTSRLLKLKVGYTDGREFLVETRDFARYDNIPQALVDGSIYAYMSDLHITGINGKKFRLIPDDIEYVELTVFPESYGAGINTEIEDFAVVNGLLRWFSIRDFDVLPKAGDEYEIYEQRCEIESVEQDPMDTMKYIVTLKETDGITIVMPPSWNGGPVYPFVFHMKESTPLGDGGVEFGLKIAKDDNNRFTGKTNRELEAWKPIVSIVDESTQPLSTFADYSLQGAISPRLIIGQAALLGGGGTISIKAGGEHWRVSAIEYLGEVYTSISLDLTGATDVACSDEYKAWILSAQKQAEEFGLDGINLHIGIETPEAAIGHPLADAVLQADADGNTYERLSPSDSTARSYLSIAVADAYNELYGVGGISLAVTVDTAMWTYRNDTRLINLYDYSSTNGYETATGQLVPTPYLREVDDITPTDVTANTDYFAWLNGELEQMLGDAQTRVVAIDPSANIDVSVNVPRVKNGDLIALEPLNNVDYYDSANWRNMFVASYEHVIDGDFAKVVADFGFWGEHGYTDSESDYLAGLVVDFADRWKWGRVDMAINYAEAAAVPRISVANANTVMRDGFMWFGYGAIGESGFSCGGGTCCE